MLIAFFQTTVNTFQVFTIFLANLLCSQERIGANRIQTVLEQPL